MSPAKPKLHGRSAEKSILLNVYFETLSASFTSAPAILVIRGEPGLGKTLLAESLRPSVEGDDGYFVHAKFDKLSYDTSAGRPYSEISAAVADFCSELKKRDEDTREEVSRALKKKISREEGDVLVEAIPSLQAVLGYNSRHYSDSSCEEKLSDSSEDIVTSRPETSSHKLPFIMKKFMSGISTGDPICFLFDDVQWANKSDLVLLRAMMASAKNPSLFIFTCRPLPNDHPFQAVIDSNPVTEISLSSLQRNAVRSLVVSTLNINSPDECTDELCSYILTSTGGNPFYIRYQLLSLQEQGLITFNDETSSWTWKMDDIRGVTDDGVVALITNKIKKLTPLTQTCLKICSCLERTEFLFLGVLLKEEILLEKPDNTPAPLTDFEYEDFARDSISSALDEGLLVEQCEGWLTFSHPIVNEACYSLIDPSERDEFHLNIGRVLYCHVGRFLRRIQEPSIIVPKRRSSWASGDDKEELEQRCFFTYAVQFARGYKLITDEKERISTTQIFLDAGDSSKKASGYAEAYYFYSRGQDLLTPTDWTRHYNLCVEITTGCAETASIIGLIDEMRLSLKAIHDNCTEKGPLLSAYLIEVRFLFARHEVKESFRIGMRALELAGYHFSGKAPLKTIVMLAKTRSMMKKKSPLILDMPIIRDKETISILSLLILMTYVSLDENRRAVPMITMTAIQLSMARGMSPSMASALACFGTILVRCGFAKNTEGAKYAAIAMEVQSKYGYKNSVANVAMMSFGTLYSFTKPLADCIKPLSEAFRVGLENGDTTHAMSCCGMQLLFRFLSGQNLRLLASILRKQYIEMKQNNLTRSMRAIETISAVVNNLLGKGSSQSCLPIDVADGPDIVGASRVLISIGVILQLVNSYLLGDIEGAMRMTTKLNDAPDILAGTILPYLSEFYRGMSSLTLLHIQRSQQGMAQLKTSLKRCRAGRKKSPQNLSHQAYLLEAEYNYLLMKYSASEKLYLQAIEHSSAVVHENALAHERLGWFYLQRSQPEKAKEQLVQARVLYSKWGSRARVKILEMKYSCLNAS